MLQAAADETTRELSERYEEESIRQSLLAAPNSYLVRLFQQSELVEEGVSAAEFIDYIERRREQDPDFLGPLGPGGLPAQLHTISSGASYEIGSLTAKLSGSYLITDTYSRWKEIELDREEHGARNQEWEPFVKAFQEVELRCLNSLSLEHALILRKDEHLESLRVFLRRVWKAAASGESFERSNAQLLGDELKDEMRRAEEEWKAIDRKLLKWFGSKLTAGFLAAGPLVASGYGVFLAAAFAVAGAANLGVTGSERKAFQTKFPAAFFLRLEQ